MNDNKFGLAVFLDLQKAFDLVDHRILLKKLEYYGVSGPSLELISSFIHDRNQCVKIKNSCSSFRRVLLGTPQGSSLSPLLFLIFINDITKASSVLHFNLFADDTSICFSDYNIENLFNTVNQELEKIAVWITANNLSLNVNKPVYLLFSGRKHLNMFPSLKICNAPIERKSETKFLGIVIDDRL